MIELPQWERSPFRKENSPSSGKYSGSSAWGVSDLRSDYRKANPQRLRPHRRPCNSLAHGACTEGWSLGSSVQAETVAASAARLPVHREPQKCVEDRECACAEFPKQHSTSGERGMRRETPNGPETPSPHDQKALSCEFVQALDDTSSTTGTMRTLLVVLSLRSRSLTSM